MGEVRGRSIGWGLAVFVLIALWLLPAAPVRAAEFHVDCSAETGGDGSFDQPFNSLGSGFELDSGDRLLIRRGTTCSGVLKVTGGGSEGSPAEVTGYGPGGLPRIVGTGQDAVLIDDASHLAVRNLDISNPGDGGPVGDGDSIRNGVRVTASTATVRGLTLSGLAIHDVDGDLTKGWQGSAGIQVTAVGAPPIRFENRHRDNGVDRSDWSDR